MKVTHLLLSSLAAAALLAPATAFANTTSSRGPEELVPTATDTPVLVIAAQSRERVDGERLAYYAAEANMARRDLAVSTRDADYTNAKWQHAVRVGNVNEAGFWAQKHAVAVGARKDATGRFLNDRSERQLAMANFRDDWRELFIFEVASHQGRQRT